MIFHQGVLEISCSQQWEGQTTWKHKRTFFGTFNFFILFSLPWQTTASVRMPQFSMHWLWALSNEMRLHISRSSSSGASSSVTAVRRAWSAACFFRTLPAPIIIRVAWEETDRTMSERNQSGQNALHICYHVLSRNRRYLNELICIQFNSKHFICPWGTI